MSHRNTLNELTANAPDADSRQEATASLHRAPQIVGIARDELSERLDTLEARADQTPHEQPG